MRVNATGSDVIFTENFGTGTKIFTLEVCFYIKKENTVFISIFFSFFHVY